MSADQSKLVEGSHLMVFANGKSIAMATSHTLTVSTETSEVSNKDLGGGEWTSNAIRRFSWEVSSDNMYTQSAYKKLFELMTNKTPVTLVFAERTGADVEEDAKETFATWTWTPDTNYQLTGTAYITSLDLTAPNDDYATFSVTFTGSGKLEQVATTPGA